jgi:putative colanic acid biosynthesis acetyltransferase WcaF
VTSFTWFLVQRLAFSRRWLPGRLRPPLLRCFGADVGEGVRIGHGVQIRRPWHVVLAERVRVGDRVRFAGVAPTTIGPDACISRAAVLGTGAGGATHIGPGAWVMAGAVVPQGTTLRAGEVVLPQEALSRGRQPAELTT